MDAFFAAVEERDRPELNGLPIVVGADPDGGYGRGVVSTANYKAREYGIHSALPISRAWRFSEEAKKQGKPAVIFLRGNFKKYEEVSANIIEIIKKYSETVEQASIDEAYFELIWLSDNQVEEIAKKIKEEVYEKEKLTSSVGIGPNKLIAKIASDFKKPDGLTVVRAEDAEKFLEPMGVRKIPGIGPKTEEALSARKIFLIKDIKNLSKEGLTGLFGKKWGEALYDKARGIDNSPLVTEWEAKSIGEQETFQKDTIEINFLMESLDSLCKNVFSRFEKEGFLNFRTISITVRFADFETKTRAHTIKGSASSLKILLQEGMKLLMPFFDKRENPHHKQVRLLGVRIEKFL